MDLGSKGMSHFITFFSLIKQKEHFYTYILDNPLQKLLPLLNVAISGHV